jgi:hypothetical protein
MKEDIDQFEETIRMCVTTDAASQEPPPPIMWSLRRYGDRAYDAILNQVRGRKLSGAETARALQCLAYLNQDGALERRLELLRIALDLTASDDIILRTKAVHSVVWGSRSLATIASQSTSADALEMAKSMPSRRTIVESVRTGLERGILSEHVEEVERFLGESDVE